MRQDFLVITQPRSGDEILISKLRSHPQIYITLGNPLLEYEQNKYDASTLSEVLDIKYKTQNYKLKREEQEITHRLNTRDYMESVYNDYYNLIDATNEEKEEVQRCLDLMYSKNKDQKKLGYDKMTNYVLSRYKTYGTTFYIHHVLSDTYNHLLNDIIQNNPNIKIIVLTRENLLWRYVSTQLQVETNEQGYTKIVSNNITLNADNIIQDIEQTLKERENLYDILKENNLKYIAVTYEDLCKNQRLTLDRIQTFLNVTIQKDDLFGINTDNIFEETRPLEAIVTNYHSLKDAFINTDYFYYFDKAEKDVNPLYYKLRDTTTEEYLQFIKAVYRKEILPDSIKEKFNV